MQVRPQSDHFGVSLDQPLHRKPRAIYPKRLCDMIGAAAVLFITLPIFCLIAIMVKVDSPGPILFLQPRHGLRGREFLLCKFRTMYSEQEDKFGTQQSVRHDARVTRVGSFLRRHSLDELPQLINVLRGEMSLIGPRPHPLGLCIGGLTLKAISDAYILRYAVRPGITGWAQVNGCRGILNEPADLFIRLEHDFYYIKNVSLGLDLRILLYTAASILRDHNAF